MKCIKCKNKYVWYDGMCKECCDIEYNKVNLNIDMTRDEFAIFLKLIEKLYISKDITKYEKELLSKFRFSK